MTRFTTGPATDEFREVARDAMKLGGRCVGAARDWLGEKREEFNMGRAAGGAGAAGAGAGVSVHGYRGIGPRGYRRDDGRVREDVCDALTDSDALDASNITVTVQDGVVKLAGTVPHRMMKRLAEDLADDCGGVRDVENALRVGPPPSVGAASAAGSAAGSSTAGAAGAGASSAGASAAGTTTTGTSTAGTSTTGGSSGPSANL